MRLIQIAPLAGLALIAACTSMPMGHRTEAAPPAPPAPAAATAAPAAQVTRFEGAVTAVAGNQITIAGAGGASSSFTLAPEAAIIKARPIQASEIRPGDFVATANTNNADGTGTSIELRVFPPGMRLGEGSFAMQAPNTTMTNATVAQVTNVGADRQLTVNFGANQANGSAAGSRTITLPASVQVVQWYRASVADIRVGSRVRGRGASNNGAVVADFVFVEDAPAAAH